MSEERDPRLKVLLTRAERASDAARPATAIALLESYLKFAPNEGHAMFLLAENLRAIGRTSDAERVMKSVENIPAAKEWLVTLCWAEIHATKGRLLEAEESFKKATDSNPDSTVPWVYYGAWLAKQERFEDAVNVLTRALASNGDLDEVYLNLGYNRRALGDYVQARDCFMKAVEMNSSYLEAEQALSDIIDCIDVLNETES